MTARHDDRLAFHTRPVCEATCGLEVRRRDDEVARIRSNRDDVFSQGLICPKDTVDPLSGNARLNRLRVPVATW